MLGAGGFGGIAVWAAAATDWLNEYGPIAWVLAGFTGVIVFMVLYLIWSAIRLRLAKRDLKQAFRQDVPTVNPMEDTFEKQKVEIAKFVRPFIAERITDKTFINCELMGPAVIVLVGHSFLQSAGIINCDFVEIQDNANIQNAMVFENLTVRGGKLYNLTILVPKSSVSQIPGGANWIT